MQPEVLSELKLAMIFCCSNFMLWTKGPVIPNVNSDRSPVCADAVSQPHDGATGGGDDEVVVVTGGGTGCGGSGCNSDGGDSDGGADGGG